MLSLITELKNIINEIRRLSSENEILICGDLNLPGIKWQFTQENSGNLTPTSAITPAELKFTEEITAHGLFQMNSYANSKGIFLDIVLSTHMTNVQVVLPMPEELIDNFSLNHGANITIITHERAAKLPTKKKHGRRNLNLAATAIALQGRTFDQPNQNDIDETFLDEPSTLAAKIQCITDAYHRIQDTCTIVTKHAVYTDAPRHPWTMDIIEKIPKCMAP